MKNISYYIVIGLAVLYAGSAGMVIATEPTQVSTMPTEQEVAIQTLYISNQSLLKDQEALKVALSQVYQAYLELQQQKAASCPGAFTTGEKT